ncbi:helix-turn-helix transcriptional regulator [Erwinia sp. 9145]|uniref:helix-turn-helix transcriptional regulator n=1 Tax=Erwinia sp. 9145 TaxID=1500895 RepID=UPI0005542E46|nr:helix-turn-helix transcriptional regulator [Erwinia sp. 9145]
MIPDCKLLGHYLKDRRGKLDPESFGISPRRRRTPGLRREEVAQRANVSATWYTWLEQGRGGSPSAEVLDRLAQALRLSAVEREHLFLLAQQRPPQAHYRPDEQVSKQLQRVLDSLEHSPALIRTATWDIVAWNDAARAVLKDYTLMAVPQRNIMRILFTDPLVREKMINWQADAASAVAAFRAEVIRAGALEQVKELVEELSESSTEFSRFWQSYDVQHQGEGVKHARHPLVGDLAFEYSSFTLDGQPDLGLVIYTPANAEHRSKVDRILDHWRQNRQAG